VKVVHIVYYDFFSISSTSLGAAQNCVHHAQTAQVQDGPTEIRRELEGKKERKDDE